MYDRDTCSTTRLKISSGSGQGEWQKTSPCLFAREEKFNKAMADHHKPDTSIQLGWISEDGKTLNTMGSDNRLDNIPPTANPVVAWVDRKSGQATAALGALMQPEMGFTPVEKLYTDDGKSHTHFSGSAITKIYIDPVEMRSDIDAALSRLSAQNSTPATATTSQAFSQSAGLQMTDSQQRKLDAAARAIASGIKLRDDDSPHSPKMVRRMSIRH